MTCLLARVVTLNAVERCFSRMDPHVFLEVTSCSETVVTVSALERFFSGVYQDVLLEVISCLARSDYFVFVF